jgi:alpha,alpha-trehalose phosphorylase
MIPREAFVVEPWTLTESPVHLDLLGQTESIFALSNGHIGVRGNLDEGEPHATPGTYLNGFYECLPLPYAERGYGNPDEGQTLIDVTNGKFMRLLVDDQPFDIRYGTIHKHERVLDLRAGVLRRLVEWTSPGSQRVRVRSTRLVSFAQRAVVAIHYEVEPLDEHARLVVQSTLVANEPVGEQVNDPRAAAALRAPLVGEYHTVQGLQVALGHRTRASHLRIAAAMGHVVECPEQTICDAESEPDLARITISTELAPGQKLTVVKLLTYGWSDRRSMPALRDQVDAALAAAKRTGWEGLLSAQREYLDEFWDRADVEIDGDPEMQQSVRFALYQIVQAAARAEDVAIPAKGLTGRGYDGHSFWDMETYTLPALTYLAPRAARDALRWRHSTLPLALHRARELRLTGAAFPWRTIHGQECSGYWPAGTAAFHINADIADAVRRYTGATDDTEFERDAGLELLVETARLWMCLGHHDAAGAFRIDGVTGPDEYTALVNNNVFTNLMAARNLRAAAAAAARHRNRAAELGVEDGEVHAWREAADQIVISRDEELGVTPQSDGFTRYRRWNFEEIPTHEYPLLLHYPYQILYSSQVVKQADLVMALFLCGDSFSPEQKQRDFAYYEAITVRDSSLSASVQAIVAAEIGQLRLAYDYFRETALIDLRDHAGNTSDGLHLASLAGTWLVAVAGFGGMRDYGETLSFAPRLPGEWSRLKFRLLYRGRRLQVELVPEGACYEVTFGDTLDILHHGETLTLHPGVPQVRRYPIMQPPPPVEPPAGRAPGGAGVGRDASEHESVAGRAPLS